jgi:hypothetical protein
VSPAQRSAIGRPMLHLLMRHTCRNGRGKTGAVTSEVAVAQDGAWDAGLRTIELGELRGSSSI